MNAEKFKNKVIRYLKDNPSMIPGIGEAFEESGTTYKGEIPNGEYPAHLLDEDENAEDEAYEKYSLNQLRKIPAKYYYEAEIYLEAKMTEFDFLEELEDLDALSDEQIEATADRMPNIKTTDSTAKIVKELRAKADPSDLVSLIDRINTNFEASGKTSRMPKNISKEKLFTLMGRMKSQELIEAIADECAFFLEAPETWIECRSTLELLLFLSDEEDKTIAAVFKKVRKLGVNLAKPSRANFQDPEVILIRQRRDIPFEKLLQIVKSTIG